MSGILEQDPTKSKLNMVQFDVDMVSLMIAGRYLVVRSCK